MQLGFAFEVVFARLRLYIIFKHISTVKPVYDRISFNKTVRAVFISSLVNSRLQIRIQRKETKSVFFLERLSLFFLVTKTTTWNSRIIRCMPRSFEIASIFQIFASISENITYVLQSRQFLNGINFLFFLTLTRNSINNVTEIFSGTDRPIYKYIIWSRTYSLNSILRLNVRKIRKRISHSDWWSLSRKYLLVSVLLWLNSEKRGLKLFMRGERNIGQYFCHRKTKIALWMTNYTILRSEGHSFGSRQITFLLLF